MGRHSISALLAGLLFLSATMSLAQAPVPQINYKQLSGHPFEVHGLKVTVQTFSAGRFSMDLTNTTSSFISFGPEDMALVDKTGSQLFLERTIQVMPMVVQKLRIAPGATLHLDGRLNDMEQFPVKMYFFDTLCAVATL